MRLSKRVSKNAKAIRIGRGLSQQDLAKRTGLTIRYISRVENDPQNLTLDVIERLLQALECTASDLIEDEKELPKPSTKALDETIRYLQSIRSRF